VWDPREPLPPLNETLEIVLCCVVCSILLQRVGRFREFDRVAGGKEHHHLLAKVLLEEREQQKKPLF